MIVMARIMALPASTGNVGQVAPLSLFAPGAAGGFVPMSMNHRGAKMLWALGAVLGAYALVMILMVVETGFRIEPALETSFHLISAQDVEFPLEIAGPETGRRPVSKANQRKLSDFARRKPVSQLLSRPEIKPVPTIVREIGYETGFDLFFSDLQSRLKGWHPLGVIREQYTAFCADGDYEPAGPRKFGTMLREAGCKTDIRDFSNVPGVRDRRRIYRIPERESPAPAMQMAA